MAQLNKTIRSRRSNVREMLIAAGVGQFNVTMSLPYVWFMPRTCDPYAQGIMQLVQALQNVINARGGNLEISGWLDGPTQRELARYAGPSWGDKTWVQLLGDVMNAPERKAPAATAALPSDLPSSAVGDLVGDVLYSPVALAATGALVYLMLRKRTAARKRSAA